MAEKGKILVVDDDRLVLATVAHGLAQVGHEVEARIVLVPPSITLLEPL